MVSMVASHGVHGTIPWCLMSMVASHCVHVSIPWCLVSLVASHGIHGSIPWCLVSLVASHGIYGSIPWCLVSRVVWFLVCWLVCVSSSGLSQTEFCLQHPSLPSRPLQYPGPLVLYVLPHQPLLGYPGEVGGVEEAACQPLGGGGEVGGAELQPLLGPPPHVRLLV